MIWDTLTANLWRAVAIVCAALAVAAVLAWAFSRAGAAVDRSRAAAAEARAQELEQDIAEMWEAVRAADVSAKASQGARDSAAQRQADRDERSARVEGYARDAGNGCTGSPDLVRELREGEGGIRAAESRLRGDRPAEGKQAQPARAD